MVIRLQDLSEASYEHHDIEEPAVDCWNVTDGACPIIVCWLIVRQRDWTNYFAT